TKRRRTSAPVITGVRSVRLKTDTTYTRIGAHMHRAFLFSALAASVILAWSCSSSKSSTPPAPAASVPNAMANTTPLIGDMKPVVSVKELMEYMIDPASDFVFDSVKTIVQPNGKVVEIVPKTDDDWKKLQVGAVTML